MSRTLLTLGTLAITFASGCMLGDFSSNSPIIQDGRDMRGTTSPDGGTVSTGDMRTTTSPDLSNPNYPQPDLSNPYNPQPDLSTPYNPQPDMTTTQNPDLTPPAPPAPGSVIGGGTGFASPSEMYNYLRAKQHSYITTHPTLHIGPAWGGSDCTRTATGCRTWSTYLNWDDTLAATAQAEANRLVACGNNDSCTPQNSAAYAYQNSNQYPQFQQEDVWFSGYSGQTLLMSGKSDGNITTGPGASPGAPNGLPQKWHDVTNGTMREGFFYQTGSLPYNRKSRMGVGMACFGNDQTVCWWVVAIQ